MKNNNLEINFEDLSNGVINRIDVNNPVWEGTGIFDKVMRAINGNIQVQFETGRITGAEYSELYLGSIQVAIGESMKFLMNKKNMEKSLEEKDVDIQLKEQDLIEREEKWVYQKEILANQVDMSEIDLKYKEDSVLRDMEIKDRQIESATADVAFNESKKIIMEYTRKDNIRSKAAEQFAEFIKYLSAANVVPGAQDFKNMRALINAMNDGIANPDMKATITTSGVDYVKPKTA